MHGAAFGASNAAFPRRISRDPPELWSQLQRSALTPLRNVKYSAHFRLSSDVVAKLAPSKVGPAESQMSALGQKRTSD